MNGQSVLLKPEKKLILPSDMPTLGKDLGIVIPDMPMKEALKKGLMHRGYTTPRGRKVPATPAGFGVFAKWCVQVIDAKSKKPCYFRHPKTGRMVKKLEAPVHSFTRNFAFFIRGFLMNLDSALNLNETLTDDTGATFLARLKSGVSGNAPSITGLAKIKFGNSSAALANTQVNLQGILLGPVTEGVVAVTLVVEDSVQTIFTVVGQVTNASGGAFAVEEMGLFPELNDSGSGTNRTTMMLRDLTGTVNVNNGQTIIGTYTFTIAV
jgi:hypothetical protein